MYRLLAIIFSGVVIHSAVAQSQPPPRIDSLVARMTSSEKIGQLMGVSFSEKTTTWPALKKIVRDHAIGTVLITHSSRRSLRNFSSTASRALLTVALRDGGLRRVVDSLPDFFSAAVQAAVADDTLRQALKTEEQREASRIGLTLVDESYFNDVNVQLLGDKKQGPTALHQWLSDGKVFRLNPSEVDHFQHDVLHLLRKDQALEKELDHCVAQILQRKAEYVADANRLTSFEEQSSPAKVDVLREKIAAAAVAITSDPEHQLPIASLDQSFQIVHVGKPSSSEFEWFTRKYVDASVQLLKALTDTSAIETKISTSGSVLIVLNDRTITASSKNWWLRIARQRHAIVCSFVSGVHTVAPDVAFIAGRDSTRGLPRAVVHKVFSMPGRLEYSLPELVGMDRRTLEKIEPIAREAITSGATPGCHVLIARKGKVIYEKSFGTLLYEPSAKVTDETLYDLASVTKVAATLQAITYLYDRGQLDLTKKASVYLPELRGTNKENMTVKDILTHQAGLWPYLPFWSETVKDTSVFHRYYSSTASADFPLPVADKMFATKALPDSLWQWTIRSKVREKNNRLPYDYRYSDMGFYIMQHLAERLLQIPIDEFVQRIIYKPIGAYTLGYQPLKRFPASRIAPTERDTLFRKSLLVGYVHDQGAAMHGGVAGHAGLYGTANDLAKLGQLWLNHGTSGRVKIFSPETVALFTAKQFEDSRRGLGWDKPVVNDWSSPTSYFASGKTFGHTGFTGTCIWVDPQFDLIYIFLSNRVHPDMNNTKLLNANIRPRIQDVIYESIFAGCK